jgi:AraC-like DNA-binding protein
LALALETPFTLSLPPEAAPETRSIALIPPDTRHRLVATGPMVFVYLAALSDDHQRLMAVDLDAAYARTMQSGASAVSTWGVDRLCAELGVSPRATADPRVAMAVRLLEAHPQGFPHVGPLAARVGLSPSRFHALFGQAVGMPFRRYRQWRRMAVVMRALSEGSSLTEAAYEAGFASSAHLSAAFRDMFGLAPSALVALGVRIELGDARQNGSLG